jgi:hypothetical protein
MATDSTGPYSPDGPWGATPTSTGPTGSDSSVLEMFPSAATGSAHPPLVVDITELIASHGAVLTHEAADRTTLSVLLNETRETLRPQMFTWAALGFPTSYIVQQFSVSPPSVCSDGVARPDVAIYTEYLLGKSIGDIVASIQSLCSGVTIAYSFLGNTLRIHVFKSA